MVGRIFNSNASLVGASWENEADCGIDMARCDVLKLRDFCVSSVLHEIKHDGFRIIARKDGAEVKLYSRPGNDFTRR